jgi:hypothetical protein
LLCPAPAREFCLTLVHQLPRLLAPGTCKQLEVLAVHRVVLTEEGFDLIQQMRPQIAVSWTRVMEL